MSYVMCSAALSVLVLSGCYTHGFPCASVLFGAITPGLKPTLSGSKCIPGKRGLRWVHGGVVRPVFDRVGRVHHSVSAWCRGRTEYPGSVCATCNLLCILCTKPQRMRYKVNELGVCPPSGLRDETQIVPLTVLRLFSSKPLVYWVDCPSDGAVCVTRTTPGVWKVFELVLETLLRSSKHDPYFPGPANNHCNMFIHP